MAKFNDFPQKLDYEESFLILVIFHLDHFQFRSFSI